MFYEGIEISRAESTRNGTKATSAMASFTNQSAIAKDTHSGASEPNKSNGTLSHAHEISLFAASGKKVMLAEKAIVKKIAVSNAEPMIVDAKGARHHVPARRRLNTAISIS